VNDLQNVNDDSISIEAKLTENGVTAKAKSRFLSAFDRLGGNIIDAIGMPLEAMNAENRKKIQNSAQIADATREIYIKNLAGDNHASAHAINRHLEGIARKQENIDDVIQVALEEYSILPDSSAEQDEKTEELEGDWLSDFESFAEKASSESLKKLFGRILSGEIRRPGSFTRKTLRVAYELDQTTTQLFVRLAQHRTTDFCILVEGLLTFTEYLKLESMGLISYVSGHAKAEFKDLNGTSQAEHMGDDFVLRVKFPSGNVIARAPIIPLTQEGVELAKLVKTDELEVLKMFATCVEGPLTELTIHKRVKQSANQYFAIPVHVVKQAS
jgi:Protein of unknown function (DUF2806)